MDIHEHKQKFDEIIKKYNLHEEDKAHEIANFLTKSKNDTVSAKEFAILFAMGEGEAVIFLKYINKGVEFKETYLDKK